MNPKTAAAIIAALQAKIIRNLEAQLLRKVGAVIAPVRAEPTIIVIPPNVPTDPPGGA